MHQSIRPNRRVLIRIFKTRCGCARGQFIKDFTEEELSIPELDVPLDSGVLENPDKWGCACSESDAPKRKFKFRSQRFAKSAPGHCVIVEEYIEA
jgi:hypothetical protein